MVESSVTYSWLQDSECAEILADFFVRNVPPEYISHGEILTGRATDERSWSPKLHQVMSRELTKCVDSFRRGGNLKAATVTESARVIGLAIVEIDESTAPPHAWLDDLVIERDARAKGVGADFLGWIEGELRREKVTSVFIETGIRNAHAHTFFERRGYSPCSLIMNRRL